MEQKQQKSRVIEGLELGEPDRISGFRYGKITRFDYENDIIWIDYDDNPLKRELQAVVASPFISLKHLRKSALRPSVAQIEFAEGDPSRPIVRDIYFSTNDKVARSHEEKNNEKVIHIKGDKIILDGTSEVIIKSGNAQTSYKSDKGTITEEAEKIRSTAKSTHRILAGSVLIN